MTESTHIRRRLAAAVAAGCAGLMLASTAGAVDLRDWGRKLPASERFVVLAQFQNQAVLDKETQLVWQRSPSQSYITFSQAHCIFASTGGRSGWRLPTAQELRSLVDPSISASQSLALPSGHPFAGLVSPSLNGLYWTSTKHPTSTHRLAMPLSGPPGGFYDLLTSLHLTWCVRGPSSSSE